MPNNKKVVFISGATGGIGKATAFKLAEYGYTVVGSGRNENDLTKLETEARSLNLDLSTTVLEVTNAKAFAAAIADTVQKHGRIDVLINNAGIMPLSLLSELKVDEWDKTIDVNLKGTLYGVAAVIPFMNKQGQGHIINISSVGGHLVLPSTSVYSATKFAVRAISEGIRQEFKGKVKSTIISPGVVKTGLADSISNKGLKDSVVQMQETGLAPEDIANAILYAIQQPHSVSVNELVIRATAH